MMNGFNRKDDKNRKKNKKKKTVKEKVKLNLFGENDLNIYIFNKKGMFIALVMSIYLTIYFYLQFQNMQAGYKDTFSSVLTSINKDKDQEDNLYKNSNFLQFYELKFEDIDLIKQLGLIKQQEESKGYAFDTHYEVDLERLKKFISFNIKFRKRQAGKSIFMMGGFRQCSKEDFISRKYYTPLPSSYSNYICFEYHKVKEHFTLKHGYLTSSKNDIHNLIIEINKCHKDCESDENIRKFLSVTWVNIYNLVEQISFQSKYNRKENKNDLTIIAPQIYSQYKLDINKYTYQILKMRRNTIQIPKGRFNLLFDQFLQQKEYTFYNYEARKHQTDTIAYKEDQIVSEDGVNFYKVEGLQVLQGQYIFLSNDVYMHEVYQYTFMDLLGQLGGTMSIMFAAFFTIIRFFNYNSILEQLYEYSVYHRKKYKKKLGETLTGLSVIGSKFPHCQNYSNSSNIGNRIINFDNRMDNNNDSDNSRYQSADNLAVVSPFVESQKQCRQISKRFSRQQSVPISFFSKWKIESDSQNKHCQVNFSMFDRYFPFKIYKACKRLFVKLKWGQNLEKYNEIIEEMEDNLCVPRLLKKLKQISYLQDDLQLMQDDIWVLQSQFQKLIEKQQVHVAANDVIQEHIITENSQNVDQDSSHSHLSQNHNSKSNHNHNDDADKHLKDEFIQAYNRKMNTIQNDDINSDDIKHNDVDEINRPDSWSIYESSIDNTGELHHKQY